MLGKVNTFWGKMARGREVGGGLSAPPEPPDYPTHPPCIVPPAHPDKIESESAERGGEREPARSAATKRAKRKKKEKKRIDNQMRIN